MRLRRKVKKEDDKRNEELKSEVVENKNEEPQKNSETKLKGTADSFKGLPMRELISAPLIAVNEAQQQLAASTLDYYNKIAFTEDGKTRCLEFDLERPVQTPGSIGKQNIHVKAPFLGMVPVPSLLIDDVNVNFQMEVTDATTAKSEENAELSSDVTGKWFSTSVSVQGKVGTSRENTRSTNQTAKYQVPVSAHQQQPTEGLSKLMDIMASCVEPLEPEK